MSRRSRDVLLRVFFSLSSGMVDNVSDVCVISSAGLDGGTCARVCVCVCVVDQ